MPQLFLLEIRIWRTVKYWVSLGMHFFHHKISYVFIANLPVNYLEPENNIIYDAQYHDASLTRKWFFFSFKQLN